MDHARRTMLHELPGWLIACLAFETTMIAVGLVAEVIRLFCFLGVT